MYGDTAVGVPPWPRGRNSRNSNIAAIRISARDVKPLLETRDRTVLPSLVSWNQIGKEALALNLEVPP